MDLKYEIQEHIGVIKSYPNGWRKEINRVAWADNPAKYDIREWNSDHTRMSKGITLYDDETNALIALLTMHKENEIEEAYQKGLRDGEQKKGKKK